MSQKWASWIGGALFAIAVVNFTAFFVLSLTWGGEALSGKIEDGRYYLAHKGRYTEVSEQRWRVSRVHTISVWVTHPVGIVAGGLLLNYARAKRFRTLHPAR